MAVLYLGIYFHTIIYCSIVGQVPKGFAILIDLYLTETLWHVIFGKKNASRLSLLNFICYFDGARRLIQQSEILTGSKIR